MKVFRICLSKYSTQLQASGIANRWNKYDEFVIYTGESRALSALEMVVHKSSLKMVPDYKILTIGLTDDIQIKEVDKSTLPKNWKNLESYVGLQSIGSQWYNSQESPVLKVPSVIIEEEFNYVINTRHPHFHTMIFLEECKDFNWDKRLM